jgi:hypothetical protein
MAAIATKKAFAFNCKGFFMMKCSGGFTAKL